MQACPQGCVHMSSLQGYLAHKTLPPRRTLQCRPHSQIRTHHFEGGGGRTINDSRPQIRCVRTLTRNPVWWTFKTNHCSKVHKSKQNRCVKVRKSIFSCIEVRKSDFSQYQGPQISFFRCIKVRKSKKMAVLTSANPVCADVKILTSAEIRCGVRTLND